LKPSEEAITLSTKIDKDPKFIQAILNESQKVVRYRMGVLIVEHKLGFIHANAGIDRSNIDQLNRHCFVTARKS
jgi:coenzyme F420-0:L-glutamate ligase/coenzyme F420-1:gamma-L-glutamate ligase